MDNTLTFGYQGKPITLSVPQTVGDEEIAFMMRHSMVVSDDPAREGRMDTYRMYGMQFSHDRGYKGSPTSVTRTIHNQEYRMPLIKYIQKYTSADDATIFRAIGKGLQSLPLRPGRDRERIQGRKHMVANILSKVAHTPITDYLDIGTGSGTVAKAIGDMLGANTQGVEVYHDDRPIPTHVIKQGELLPPEWEGRFQLVTAFSVMHHVQGQEAMLRDIYRVLAPGGILLLREHDYVDDAIVYREQAPHMPYPQRQEVEARDTISPELVPMICRPFRSYLDAIHVVSMAITGDTHELWAQYRSLREWQAMLLGMGYQHSYLSYVTPETTKIDGVTRHTNPQRIFEDIYRKPPDDRVPLILEHLIRRADRIGDFFPRIRRGGELLPLPTLREGINYNEEVLMYMTPWRAAQQTSRLIADIMKDRYPRIRTYSLMDGTGGAGGNAIAFSQNRNIGRLTIYEQVDTFYRFIVNNLSLYTGEEPKSIRGGNIIVNDRQRIFMYGMPFPINDAHYKGNILFLDVPWVHEGGGYRLQGYRYSGLSLEDLARKALNAGALMVMYKLPPGYRLGIRHKEVPMGKESLYYTFPWQIRDTPTAGPSQQVVRVQGGSPTHEAIRMKLMGHLRDEFLRLMPTLKDGDFLRWVYDRINSYDTLDTLIPATREYVPSPFLMQEQIEVPLTYRGVVSLVRREYPQLIPETRFPPGNRERLEALRQRIQAMGSGSDAPVRELDRIARDMYHLYIDAIKQISPTTGVSIARGMVTIPIPDVLDTLPGPPIGNRGTISLPILAGKVDSLRQRHIGRDFNSDLAAMLMRYTTMMQGATNLQAALPMPVFLMLQGSSLGVTAEVFASPLNASLMEYHSAFPDTDRAFGSLGSFFRTDIEEGSYEANPPFIEDTMIQMAKRMETQMAIADRDGKALSYLVVVPNWASSEALSIMEGSQHRRWDTILPPGTHRYVVGDQHTSTDVVSFGIETHIYILQSQAGTIRYPIPDDMRQKLLTVFR